MKKKHTKHTKKPAAKKARRPSTRSHVPEPAIVVVNLGQAVSIEYRREKDGKTYRHQFGNNVHVHRTRDGTSLVINPVRASDFIRG